jgi:hypothetical protein
MITPGPANSAPQGSNTFGPIDVERVKLSAVNEGKPGCRSFHSRAHNPSQGKAKDLRKISPLRNDKAHSRLGLAFLRLRSGLPLAR